MVEAVVVDDSQFMRVQVRKILEEGGVTVLGEVHDGTAAVEAVREHQPDVVTMDVKMPGMDGIEAVERIMECEPTPILMLSRYTADGNQTTFEALEAGAVDFFPKPDSDASTTLVSYADDLVETVKVVAQADVTPRRPTGRTFESVSEAVRPATDSESPERPPTVVIAASTGGPPLVQSILETLPTGLGLRLVVVQHMPDQFTRRFAERLDRYCEFDVREATDSDLLGPEEAVVAAGGHHLVVTDDTGETLELELSDDPPVHSVRPAADVTLESAAETVLGPLVSVVLTGMGRDGAAGTEHVRACGGTTIAQQPETASIASMPENAIATGGIDDIRSDAQLPAGILDALDEPVESDDLLSSDPG